MGVLKRTRPLNDEENRFVERNRRRAHMIVVKYVTGRGFQHDVYQDLLAEADFALVLASQTYNPALCGERKYVTIKVRFAISEYMRRRFFGRMADALLQPETVSGNSLVSTSNRTGDRRDEVFAELLDIIGTDDEQLGDCLEDTVLSLSKLLPKAHREAFTARWLDAGFSAAQYAVDHGITTNYVYILIHDSYKMLRRRELTHTGRCVRSSVKHTRSKGERVVH